MRLANIKRDDGSRAALVIDHPRDGSLWAIPAAGGATPVSWDLAYRTTRELLTKAAGNLDHLRRTEIAWQSILSDDGSPGALRATAIPLIHGQLLSPVTDPPLIFGLVGNNATFVRADHTRARNLQLPAGHARPPRSFVGPGDAVLVPAEATRCSATTELGVVIGRLARNIDAADAMHYVAGYTIVNDLVIDCYTQNARSRHPQYDINTPTGFHVANSASWLDKSADTMCSIGPWIVTCDEIPDPYDLLVSFRANGACYDRAYSGTLLTGVDQLVSWASHLFPLEPGAVLHLGAMGRDGVPTDLDLLRRDGVVRIESEIERIGVLANVVTCAAVASSPTGPDSSRAEVATRRSFWVMLGNSAAGNAYYDLHDEHAAIAYNTPSCALGANHARVNMPIPAHQLAVAAELAVVIDEPITNATPDEVHARLRGYALMLSFHDESISTTLLSPHRLPQNMPAIYARWHEQFNVLGEIVPSIDASRAVSCVVDGQQIECAELVSYTIPAEVAVAELSTHITLWPGDVITLGILTQPINLGLLPSQGNNEIGIEAFVPSGPAVSATLLLN